MWMPEAGFHQTGGRQVILFSRQVGGETPKTARR